MVLKSHLCWAAVSVGLLFGSEAAYAAPVKINVHILVIEASKTVKTFDKRIGKVQTATLKDQGYTGAKVLDVLSTEVELGSRVSLEILGGTGKSRNLQVKVLSVEPEMVKLRVAIKEFKFSTNTIHKKGGTLMVAFKTDKGKALFLAVTPKKG